VWYRLSVYSMSPQECHDNLEDIKVNLLKAWNAVG
jgi:hypothetical protein